MSTLIDLHGKTPCSPKKLKSSTCWRRQIFAQLRLSLCFFRSDLSFPLTLLLPSSGYREQYSLTKSSWLADYCKKEEQPPQPSAALSWMGPPPPASDRVSTVSPKFTHTRITCYGLKIASVEKSRTLILNCSSTLLY